MGAGIGAGLGALLGGIGRGLQAHAQQQMETKQQNDKLLRDFYMAHPTMLADPQHAKAAESLGLNKDVIGTLAGVADAYTKFHQKYGIGGVPSPSTVPQGFAPSGVAGSVATTPGAPAGAGAVASPSAPAPPSTKGPPSPSTAPQAFSKGGGFTPTITPERMNTAQAELDKAKAEYAKYQAASADPVSQEDPGFKPSIEVAKFNFEQAQKDYDRLEQRRSQEEEFAYRMADTQEYRQEMTDFRQQVAGENQEFKRLMLGNKQDTAALGWREKKETQLQGIRNKLLELKEKKTPEAVIAKLVGPMVDTYNKTFSSELKQMKAKGIDAGDIDGLEAVPFKAGSDPANFLAGLTGGVVGGSAGEASAIGVGGESPASAAPTATGPDGKKVQWNGKAWTPVK